jgi:signal peptidase II
VTALVATLVLVPLLDQGLKRLLRRRLGRRVARLGPLGSVELVAGRMWLSRALGRPGAVTLGAIWLLASLALVQVGVLLPSSAGFAGLLAGGSLSHLLEAGGRGTVVDCFRLASLVRFDLADAAILAGGLGMLAHIPLAFVAAAP